MIFIFLKLETKRGDLSSTPIDKRRQAGREAGREAGRQGNE